MRLVRDLTSTRDTPAPAPQVRPLVAGDEAGVLRLARLDRALSLFITGNVLSYGFHYGDVRFWGLWRSDEEPALVGALMTVGATANLFTLPGEDCAPLVSYALARRLEFIMGGAEHMAVVLAQAGDRPRRIEHHHLAVLSPNRFARHLARPPKGARVRRAAARDVPALARFYLGSPGFHQLSLDRLRETMTHRVNHMRTFVVETEHGIAAAASTSAETHADAMIGAVFTAPWARNQGFATTVVAALADDLERQHRRPHLFYLIDNAAAARVYAKIGFRVEGGWKVIYLDEL